MKTFLDRSVIEETELLVLCLVLSQETESALQWLTPFLDHALKSSIYIFVYSLNKYWIHGKVAELLDSKGKRSDQEIEHRGCL